jgi:D-xylose 1-dehydrogenase (NADP+, D-xylono-1,5-lactone-forming)
MTRWGLLSTARINDALLRGIEAIPDATAYAVASRDAERASAYAQRKGIERAYGSYEQLLADPEVDVVYISLPNGMHVQWTRRALEAGKHVLCEKPLSRSPAEVESLFDLAAARDLYLSEAFMYRHHPQTKRLKELVDTGVIGTLRLIRGTFSFTCDPADPRMRSDQDGGGLMDVGCYPVSMARYLAGEPDRVSAEELLGGLDVDVVMAGLLHFADGVIAHFDGGLAMPNRRDVEVVGSNAVLRVPNPWHPLADGIELWRDGAASPEVVAVAAADSYALEVADLSAAARGEHEPLLGRADALGQARAIEALYASARSGQTIAL